MMVKFHYIKRSHGPLPWSGYAIVDERLEDNTTVRRITIRTGSCSFKFGARRELRRLVRQHYRAFCRDFHDEEMIDVHN